MLLQHFQLFLHQEISQFFWKWSKWRKILNLLWEDPPTHSINHSFTHSLTQSIIHSINHSCSAFGAPHRWALLLSFREIAREVKTGRGKAALRLEAGKIPHTHSISASRWVGYTVCLQRWKLLNRKAVGGGGRCDLNMAHFICTITQFISHPIVYSKLIPGSQGSWIPLLAAP